MHLHHFQRPLEELLLIACSSTLLTDLHTSILAFLPHSPSKASWDRFPNKITCSKVFVSGSALGANPAQDSRMRAYFTLLLLLPQQNSELLTSSIQIHRRLRFCSLHHSSSFSISFLSHPLFLSIDNLHTHIHVSIHAYYYFLNSLRINISVHTSEERGYSVL